MSTLEVPLALSQRGLLVTVLDLSIAGPVLIPVRVNNNFTLISQLPKNVVGTLIFIIALLQ